MGLEGQRYRAAAAVAGVSFLGGGEGQGQPRGVESRAAAAPRGGGGHPGPGCQGQTWFRPSLKPESFRWQCCSTRGRELCCLITAINVSPDCRLWPVQRLPAGQTFADLLRQPSLRVPRNHQREAVQGPRGRLCLASCVRECLVSSSLGFGKALGVFPGERCRQSSASVVWGNTSPKTKCHAVVCGSHSGVNVVGCRWLELVLPHAPSTPGAAAEPLLGGPTQPGWGPGQPGPAAPPSRLVCPSGRWTAGPWAFSSTSWSMARCRSMAMTTRLWSSRSRVGTTGNPRSCRVSRPPPPCALPPLCMFPSVPDPPLPQMPAG